MNHLLILVAVIGVNPGDILITRNATEAENTTPGWWNHSAIYIGKGWVVEAQEGRGVIATPFDEFYRRYPYILVMRPKGLCCHRQRRMIESACHLLGQPYSQTRSIWFLFYDFQQGWNCVSVVRTCYSCGYGYDPWWVLPDSIAADKWNLVPVESKGLGGG